ncbi:MAG: class I tRNA ligase family protein, partial [Paramuribaculum sp.]|nr:class I tRNA ligase family protein [Paramuribaculum sp.]
LEPLVIVLAPFAPHVAEELWHSALGHDTTVNDAQWPQWDERHLVEASANYAVSFNGKVRFTLTLPADTPAPEVEKIALSDPSTQKWIEGKSIRKVIVVPKKIVNIVIG